MATWKSRNLDTRDYMILLTLEQGPELSNAKIAERIGASPETVRLRLRALKAKGVLRPDRTVDVPLLGKRLQTEIEIAYLPSRLGLMRQHVIFEGLNTRKQLDILKALCDAHPYTHYRVVTFGQQASLYVQFDIPPNTKTLMHELYERLKRQNICSKYFLLDAKFVAGRSADLQRWNFKTKKWEVEYGKKSAIGSRLSRIENLWAQFMESKSTEKPKEIVPKTLKFDTLDLILLRELSVNSRPNYTQLAAIYGKDPTTISRRIDKIKEQIAPNHILYYDRSVFDLTYPQLITGEFQKEDELTLEGFYGFLKSGILPFEAKGLSDGQRFLLFTMTPPSFAPELSEFFWEHSSQMHLYQLQLDAAYTYYFYHKNWNEEIGWQVGEDYVVNEPLNAVGLE